jgi:hypothetical protein
LAAGSVPSDFTQTLEEDYTPEEIAAQGTYSLEDLQSWGYLGGYEREFERRDNSDPMKISSDAGAYRTSGGIARAFQRNIVNCQTGGWRIVRNDVELGTESMLCARDTSIRGYNARVFFVIWYSGRVKSAVTVTGLLGKNTTELALRLARRQAANY